MGNTALAIFAKMGKTLAFFLFAFGLLGLPQVGSSQETNELNFVMSTNSQLGFIIPHRNGMKNLLTGHVRAIELNYEKATNGQKQWHRNFDNPYWGFSLQYFDFGNPTELGQAYSFYPFFLFPVVKKPRWQLLYRVGSGAAFINKPFHLKENYKNIVIGSRINAVIAMHGSISVSLTEKIGLRAGLTFTHFSNGASKLPNLGINTPTINGGLNYSFYSEKAEKDVTHDTNDQKIKGTKELHCIGSLGTKQIPPVGGKNHPAFGVYIEGVKYISNSSKLGLSADFFYNLSNEQRLIDDTNRVAGFGNVAQSGLFLSYQVKVWKVTMLTGIGTYTYNKFRKDGSTYERIGSRLHISQRMFINMILKSHLFRADFIEWGIGYKIAGK